MTKSVELKTKKDTESLAKSIAPTLKAGSVLLLSGDLGTGKTYFTGQLCKFLNVNETVNSPSFVLVNQYYSGTIPVFHIDLYRLTSYEEALQLGIEEFCEQGIVVIEWPEIIEALFDEYAKQSENNQVIKLHFSCQKGQRTAKIS